MHMVNSQAKTKDKMPENKQQMKVLKQGITAGIEWRENTLVAFNCSVQTQNRRMRPALQLSAPQVTRWCAPVLFLDRKHRETKDRIFQSATSNRKVQMLMNMHVQM